MDGACVAALSTSRTRYAHHNIICTHRAPSFALRSLRWASPELRGDEEVVLVAVNQRGGALEYASDALKASKNVVLAAVANYHRALFAAVPELMFSDDVLDAAHVECGGIEWDSVIEDRCCLMGDREYMLPHVERNGMVLEHAAPYLRADLSFVRAAYAQSRGAAVRFAATEAVLQIVAKNASALKYASMAHQNDAEIVLTALKGGTSWQKGEALKFAAAELRGDKAFMLEAVSVRPSATAHAYPLPLAPHARATHLSHRPLLVHNIFS